MPKSNFEVKTKNNSVYLTANILASIKTASLLIFLLFCLSGCFEKRELEDLAYVIAIGIDTGETQKYNITYQVAVPIKIAGEGSDNAGKDSTTLVTSEADSLYNSISKVNSLISKELTLSHNKIIVCSEELAQKGLDEILNSLITSREIRPKTSIIIHKGKSKEFLENLEPILEKNPARYYDLLLSSSEYTGYAVDNSLFSFYLSTQDDFSNAFTMITETPNESKSPQNDEQNASSENQSSQNDEQNASNENQSSQNDEQNTSNENQSSQNDEQNASSENQSSQNDEQNASSEDIPKTADPVGIAVFKNDSLVGEIRGEQIISHLIMQGKLRKVNINIEDIEDKAKITSIKLSQTESPNINITLNNIKPEISIDIPLQAELMSSGSPIDYTKKENRQKLGKAIEDKVKKDTLEYLQTIAKEYQSDIIGLGKHIRPTIATLEELNKIDWEKLFPQSGFKVSVRVHLDTTQMITNEFDLKSK